MRRFFFALLAMLLTAEALVAASQKYFLPPQRLRRLQRDRERQTPRWVNFESRINTVKDSPERGLELALHYVITRDQISGSQAITWARSHPCDIRQNDLIHNWVPSEVMGPIDHWQPLVADCGMPSGPVPQLLAALASQREPDVQIAQRVTNALQSGNYTDGAQLYAAVEFLALWREATRNDAREQAPRFFSALPTLLLLAQKPQAIEHPTWQMHIASLALVALDPNSTGAQFLQGWAIEDRQMLHDGPGVLYELLWADPYLPGVGYQNLDPWLYDEESKNLFARADWSPQACWIHLSPSGKEEANCPNNWAAQRTHFGHLNLVPFTEKCMDVKRSASEATIFSGLSPGQKLHYDDGGEKKQTGNADPSGLWRVPVTITGKVCAAR